VNIYRPSDLEKFAVEKIADLDAFKLDQLQALLQQRLDHAIAGRYSSELHVGKAFDDVAAEAGPNAQERDAIEKRHAAAFLLFALSQLRAPDSAEPLLPNQFERAQVVSGLYEFAQAAQNYVRSLRELEGRVLDAIAADRRGYEVTIRKKLDDGKEVEVPGTTSGFVDEHAAEIARLKKVVAHIRHAEERLKDLQSQRDRYQKQHEERLAHLTETTKKLTDARANTAKTLAELQQLQKELFRAQVELSDAAERNFRLEALIRQAEGMKGGAKQQ
jgi:DNA repair exonuclease SbcCD ATPase subunit